MPAASLACLSTPQKEPNQMIFSEIVTIDFQRSLSERAMARKSCGPYRWTPSEPGKGRGFYQSSKGLFVDQAGSSFDLRLEEANGSLPAYSRNARINGYYCDNFQDGALTPIIARLPRGRGFLAGWTMGRGMCASLGATIYRDTESAAYAAHSAAEYDAEENQRMNATQTWIVGTNMPGYLPDSEPNEYDSHADAKAALIDEIECDIDGEQDALGSDDETDAAISDIVIDLQQVLDWAKALPEGHEFGSTANNRHYWLTKP
jgi:hypothetical protein